jgi:hypothetical protein
MRHGHHIPADSESLRARTEFDLMESNRPNEPFALPHFLRPTGIHLRLRGGMPGLKML